MTAVKSNIHWGFMADVESSYGAGATLLAATHGVQLVEIPELDLEYSYDGARPRQPGSRGSQRRVAPQGRTVRPTFLVEHKGSGAAYSASVKPRGQSAFLRAAGFTETIDTTGGAEKATYAPTAVGTAPTSMTYEAYVRPIVGGNPELWQVRGVYCDWMFECKNGEPARWSFPTFGIMSSSYPTESSSMPSITYHPSVVPPIAGPLTLTVNSVSSLVVRSLTVKGNRQILDRYPDLNGTGVGGLHAGFQPGEHNVEFSFTIEKPTIATQDYLTLQSAGTVFAASFTAGTAQYNKSTWTFAQAQVKEVKHSTDNMVPMLDVTCSAHTSTGILADDISIQYA